jgi:hypothetical protein
VRVVKQKDGGIVRRVMLVDDAGEVVGAPTRFLDHLMDAGYSPHTVCAYGYDLRYLLVFLAGEALDWREFQPATALRFLGLLRRLPSRRPAQRLGMAVATAQGRLLVPATVQRVLAATSSFYEWAIAAGVRPTRQPDAAASRSCVGPGARASPTGLPGRPVASSRCGGPCGCDCRCGCRARWPLLRWTPCWPA